MTAPRYLLSIDPSTKQHVAALWIHGNLDRIMTGTCDILDSADLIALTSAVHIAIESQQVYGRTTHAASIIKLAQAAGYVVGAIEHNLPNVETEVTWVLPRQWKKQIPKPPSGPWAKYGVHVRNSQPLAPAEVLVYNAALKGQNRVAAMDIIDAVGIGLWKLGRTK